MRKNKLSLIEQRTKNNDILDPGKISVSHFTQKKAPQTANGAQRNKIKSGFFEVCKLQFIKYFYLDGDILDKTPTDRSSLSIRTKNVNKEANKSLHKLNIIHSPNRNYHNIQADLGMKLKSERKNLSRIAFDLSQTFS